MPATMKGALPLQPYAPAHDELPAPTWTRFVVMPTCTGYWRISDRETRTTAVYTRDGHHQHGDLRLSREAARALIRDQYPHQEG